MRETPGWIRGGGHTNLYQPMTTMTTYQRGIHYMGVKIFNSLLKKYQIMLGNVKTV